MQLTSINSLNWGFTQTQVLSSAIELDIFTIISEGKHTVNQIARFSRSSTRGIRMLLDALTALNLLVKKSGRYYLTQHSRTYLSRKSEFYLGEFFSHIRLLRERWQGLTEAVRKGKPAQTAKQSSTPFGALVKGLFLLNFEPARRCAQELKVEKCGAVDVLDIGAGSAVWSISVALRNRKAQIYPLDIPEILEIAQHFARRYSVEDRMYPLPGDLRKVRFEKRAYDLIFLGHICHSEGRKASARLIQRSAKALKRGGRLIIADFIPNDKRTAPLFPLLFALNMLINTEDGDVFSFGEYRDWLRSAGLRCIRKLEVGMVSHLILARKP